MRFFERLPIVELQQNSTILLHFYRHTRNIESHKSSAYEKYTVNDNVLTMDWHGVNTQTASPTIVDIIFIFYMQVN